MGDELHKLYLLEFLVHSVQYKSTIQLDKDFLETLGPTCIQLKAEYLPPLTVSEIDFCPRDWFSSKTVKFKSGKSCLFSLGNQCVNTCEIKVDISVKRLLPEGSKNSHYCMGRANLTLCNKFVKVLNSKGEQPESQCTKECLELRNSLGECIGDVKFILRLTCFGTVIVTEFQKNQDDSKNFLFKGDQVLPGIDDSICGRKNNQFPPFLGGAAQMRQGPEFRMGPTQNPNFMNQQMHGFQNQGYSLGMNQVPNPYQQVYNLQGMSCNPNSMAQNPMAQQQYPSQFPMNQMAMGQNRSGCFPTNQGAMPQSMNTQGFNFPPMSPFNLPMTSGFPTPRRC